MTLNRIPKPIKAQEFMLQKQIENELKKNSRKRKPPLKRKAEKKPKLENLISEKEMEFALEPSGDELQDTQKSYEILEKESKKFKREFGKLFKTYTAFSEIKFRKFYPTKYEEMNDLWVEMKKSFNTINKIFS